MAVVQGTGGWVGGGGWRTGGGSGAGHRFVVKRQTLREQEGSNIIGVISGVVGCYGGEWSGQGHESWGLAVLHVCREGRRAD